MKRPTIVCLCGSTRFADDFNREAERLTLEGKIVVRPEVVAYSADNDPQLVDPATKIELDELHLRKIDLADRVFVLNVGGYIGDSTAREIAYTIATGKAMQFLEPRHGEDFLERNKHELGKQVAAFGPGGHSA